MTAKNAKPVRQLGPKSFTSSPKRLERREDHKIRGDKNTEGCKVFASHTGNIMENRGETLQVDKVTIPP